MNILQQAEDLKQLTDQQLAQVRGRVPDYLAVAELQRRSQMRQAYQADQAAASKGRKGTISDDLWKSVEPQPMMPPQGMPQQQQAPPQQPMSIGGMVQRLASGGMVRYAGGGGIADWIKSQVRMPEQAQQASPVARTREQFEAMLGPMPTDAEVAARAQKMYGDDKLAAIMQQLEAQKAQSVVGKPSIWQALMRNGAAMMASRNPTPLGGLGEGIAAALSGYSEDRDKYRGDQIRMQQQAVQNLNQRAGVAEQQNRRQQGIAGLGGYLLQQATSRGNTIGALLNQSQMAEEAQRERKGIAQMNIDAMADSRQAMAEQRAAQAVDREELTRQRKEEAEVKATWLKKANGDPALAETMRKAALAKAQHFETPQRLSPEQQIMAEEIAQMKSEGMSPSEIRTRLNSGKSRESERKAVANVENIVERDMREWAKDFSEGGGMSATAEQKAKRRRDLTLELATRAGVLDLILEREAKAAGDRNKDTAPPPPAIRFSLKGGLTGWQDQPKQQSQPQQQEAGPNTLTQKLLSGASPVTNIGRIGGMGSYSYDDYRNGMKALGMSTR